MNCKQVMEELVFRLVDDDLAQDLIVAYRHHLEHCPHCAQCTQRTQYVLTLVRERSPRRQAPKRLRVKILASLPHRRDLTQ